jgi:hypothetical protein
VVLVSDGGPNRRAARRPVVGAERVARLLINLTERAFGRARATPIAVKRDVAGGDGLNIARLYF